MNIVEILVLNTVLISFPIIILLFYFAYNKNVDKEEKNLFFDIGLISSFYLIFTFGESLIEKELLLFVHIPLIMAYYKKRVLSIVLISILLIGYENSYFNVNIYYLVFEYITYFIIFILFERLLKSNKGYIYIGCLKVTVFIIWVLNSGYFLVNDELLLKTIILILITIFIFIFSKIIFHKTEDILKYHMTLKELEQKKQFRTTIFRIIHEIKNPIAVCKGYLDMFDVNNIECSQKYVPILKEEIARTLILLQDFLSISKIKIEKEIIDINMILDNVMDNFKVMLKNKKIKYQFNIPDQSIYVLGDYNRLTQVLINIMKNSIEAVEKQKKGFIQVDVLIDNDIHIFIKDNGDGIESDILEKIKNPFFTTKPNGTGLGVSLSCEIIESHNGQIIYTSEKNEGTTVEIILPKYNEKTNNGFHNKDKNNR